MKIKFRPFTALLLVLLRLSGVCAVSYHMGFFDAFFAEQVEEVLQMEGEGPVVRREVTDLVLPLESSAIEVNQPADGLNEADISAGNNSVAPAEIPAEKVAPAASEKQTAVADPKNTEPKAEPKPESKPKVKPESKSTKVVSARGALSNVKVSCQSAKAVLEVGLTSAAGKISWFNLEKPRRLVVDLHGKWQNKGKSVYRIKDCPLQKIVLGEHPNKIRLVIYLSDDLMLNEKNMLIVRDGAQIKIKFAF